jgi:hypothetical protein
MSWLAAGSILVAFAVALVVAGAPQAAVLVGIAAGAVALLAPTEDRQDARRRQARRGR